MTDTHPNRARRRTSRHATMVSVLAAASVLIAACGSAGTELIAGVGDLGHVHDLVLDDDGVLLVASHTGLYRIESPDRAVLVGAKHHDLMSMTGLEDGVLMASGHPDLRFEEYRVEGQPAVLGLARSSNGGESWEILDLLGHADFHALVPVGDGLFAAESAGRIWYMDPDDEWDQLGEVDARDLAIAPNDSNHQIAPDYEGGVWASSDGAVNWTRIEGAPALVEIEWVDTEMILGVDSAGVIWASAMPQDPWTEIATGPSEVETFYVDPAGSWWVAVHGGAIERSDDRGVSWIEVYAPPDNR